MLTLEELIYELKLGREIEFSLHGNQYFMSYCENLVSTYYIWDCQEHQRLCQGSLEDVLNFRFEGTHSFQNSISFFSFDYIL